MTATNSGCPLPRPHQRVRTPCANRPRRTYGEGTDLTIVTYGNGLHMSLRSPAGSTAHRSRPESSTCAGSPPLPIQDIVREANATGRVLVVDETRSCGGVAEGVVTALVDEGFTGPLARVASEDSFIPLGDAAPEVVLSEDTVGAAVIKLTQVRR